MQKIKNSKKLQRYLEMSQFLLSEITPEMVDRVDEEYEDLGKKLNDKKYAYIIRREPYYVKFSEELRQLNYEKEKEIALVRELENSIMKIKTDEPKLRKAIT